MVDECRESERLRKQSSAFPTVALAAKAMARPIAKTAAVTAPTRCVSFCRAGLLSLDHDRCGPHQNRVQGAEDTECSRAVERLRERLPESKIPGIPYPVPSTRERSTRSRGSGVADGASVSPAHGVSS